MMHVVLVILEARNLLRARATLVACCGPLYILGGRRSFAIGAYVNFVWWRSTSPPASAVNEPLGHRTFERPAQPDSWRKNQRANWSGTRRSANMGELPLRAYPSGFQMRQFRQNLLALMRSLLPTNQGSLR